MLGRTLRSAAVSSYGEREGEEEEEEEEGGRSCRILVSFFLPPFFLPVIVYDSAVARLDNVRLCSLLMLCGLMRAKRKRRREGTRSKSE